MENDFVIHGEDYIDCIHNSEDMEKFNRMKFLAETELHKPAKECLNAVIEFSNLEADLLKQPRKKFIIQGNPNSN